MVSGRRRGSVGAGRGEDHDGIAPVCEEEEAMAVVLQWLGMERPPLLVVCEPWMELSIEAGTIKKRKNKHSAITTHMLVMMGRISSPRFRKHLGRPITRVRARFRKHLGRSNDHTCLCLWSCSFPETSRSIQRSHVFVLVSGNISVDPTITCLCLCSCSCSFPETSRSIQRFTRVRDCAPARARFRKHLSRFNDHTCSCLSTI